MKIEPNAVFKIYRFPSQKSQRGYKTLSLLIKENKIQIGDTVVCGLYQDSTNNACVIKGPDALQSFKEGNRSFTIPKYCLKKA